MVLKNNKKLLIAGAAVLGIIVLILFTPHNVSSSKLGTGGKIIESIDIQNNVLTNYFNSLYNNQLLDIDAKYRTGSISQEERDKQLNAVIKNREITLNTLNKLSNVKKDIFTGNITKKDILIKINSFDDLDTDIKTEINATLNGYDRSV